MTYSKTALLSSALLSSALVLCACAAEPQVEAETQDTPVETLASETVASETVVAETVAAEPAPYDPAPVPNEYLPDPSVLIYSDTSGWRHEEGIAGGVLAVMQIAGENGLGYYTTQHSEVFNDETLARFDAVVMVSATGDTLAPTEKAAFERWLSDDGALVLIHGSLDGSQKDWGFYQDELVGPLFISHPFDPQMQDADVVQVADAHPVMAGLPERFSANDEWYTFDGVPDGRFTIIAGLDESTYSPVNKVYGVEDLRMGSTPAEHPIVWSRCLPDGGRVVASALGHTIESFEGAEHRRLIANALDWTRLAGEDDVGCEAG